MATAAIAIAVYLGLAVHVVTHNPRHLINWVFGGFCLTVVIYYLSSLFLFPEWHASLESVVWLLRWKWAAISLTPSLYLHLVSFYFPSSWRRLRPWILLPAYVGGAGLALAALFTRLVVAGPYRRPPPHIVGVMSGPLMYPFVEFFILAVIVGIAGLAAGYRTAHTPSLRRQIRSLLVPTGFIILGSVVDWIVVLTRNTEAIPHQVADISIILAGFLFTSAVLRHGSFAGRPTARRDLFYSVLMAALGLGSFYLALALDRWLGQFTPFPFPLATGILVIVAAVSFPVVSRWARVRLDGLLFQAERRQQAMAHELADVLVETADVAELQVELLGALCIALGVHGGYLALPDSQTPAGMLAVQVVYGNVMVVPGDHVPRPPLPGPEPQLAAPLIAQAPAWPGWRDAALFCPLGGSLSQGVLVLSEKQNGKPFTQQDLAFCSELAGQIDTAQSLNRLRDQRNRYLEAAQLREQALRNLEKEVLKYTQDALRMWDRQALPMVESGLEIRLLGPLEVVRNGQPVPEEAWGTEKAKALLAYLMWKCPVGASREELSEALWPDRSPEESANVFHVTLYRLRRVLEPDRQRGSRYILHEGGRYRFNSQAPHWLDVAAFRSLLDADEPAILRQAVALYRGSYLEDVSWSLPPEAEWERRVMERLYADGLRWLAAHAERQQAEFYLEKLLAVEPADDEAQRALVLSYLARGRRDLARRQVVRWREALSDLDVEPSPEVRDLWQKIEDRM
jgi:DNA-binding SARP family transcriptional activator